MRTSDVRAVQRLYAALGLYAGRVDGDAGPLTRAAHEALGRALWPSTAIAAPDPETALLISELERDEGRVLHAYTDSLGYLTIGIGRLIDKRRGGGISNAEADLLKANDIAKVRANLDERLPWWRSLDPVRRRAIQNMAFQLGIAGLMKFTGSLPLIRDGAYERAAANLRASLWAKQTPSRAARVISMIETGAA